MASFSKETNILLAAFGIIFFSGFFLANPVLVGASFIPLFIYVMAVFITPLKVQIERTSLNGSTTVGDTFEVKVVGKIKGGVGAVVVWDEVPEPFQLVEGNNYKVVSKKLEEKEFSFSYKIKCTKCGDYCLGEGWEPRHLLGLTHAQRPADHAQEVRKLRVLPTLPKIRKIKSPLRTALRVHPSGSVAQIGPMSTDFKEIRDYVYGDAYRSINWKASARAVGFGNPYPLVNEYEREGKLSIWLFLDANPDIKIGTSIENTLEYGIRASHIMAHYFLNKGYSLGMYVYNHLGETLDFETGKKQYLRITDRLLKLSPPNPDKLQVFWNEGFSRAVRRNQRSLISRSPAIVIITHVTSKSWDDLVSGLRKILAHARNRKPNILLVNILPYDMIPKTGNWEEEFAAQMLEISSRSVSKRLRSFRLDVLDWNPTKESIENMLLNTTRLR